MSKGSQNSFNQDTFIWWYIQPLHWIYPYAYILSEQAYPKGNVRSLRERQVTHCIHGLEPFLPLNTSLGGTGQTCLLLTLVVSPFLPYWPLLSNPFFGHSCPFLPLGLILPSFLWIQALGGQDRSAIGPSFPGIRPAARSMLTRSVLSAKENVLGHCEKGWWRIVSRIPSFEYEPWGDRTGLQLVLASIPRQDQQQGVNRNGREHKVMVRKTGDALYPRNSFLWIRASGGQDKSAIGPSRPFPGIRPATTHCLLPPSLIHPTLSYSPPLWFIIRILGPLRRIVFLSLWPRTFAHRTPRWPILVTFTRHSSRGWGSINLSGREVARR